MKYEIEIPDGYATFEKTLENGFGILRIKTSQPVGIDLAIKAIGWKRNLRR